MKKKHKEKKLKNSNFVDDIKKIFLKYILELYKKKLLVLLAPNVYKITKKKKYINKKSELHNS